MAPVALPLGQCCIFGAAFNGECAASAHAAGPCGKPGRSLQECSASVPCECTNNITGTSTGVTQARSDELLPERLALGYNDTQADFKCCIWAGGMFNAWIGCDRTGGYGQSSTLEFAELFRDSASGSWGRICEYGGASEGRFVNCQLSCYRSGFVPDGWEAACAKTLPVDVLPQGTSLPFRASPSVFSERRCCPSGSTYSALGYVGAECVGPFLSAAGNTSDVMGIAAIKCSCHDLCDSNSVSAPSCRDRVTTDEGLLADGDLVAGYECDSWAAALRPERDAAGDGGWKMLCSASYGMPSFDGFSGARLLLARQTWSVSSWSKCMYSCHIHGYTHDQWLTLCAWPSPPPSLPAPSPLPLVTQLSSRTLPPSCGSGCIVGIVGGVMGLVTVLGLCLVRRSCPSASFCWLFKRIAKEEDRQHRLRLRTEDVSLHQLNPELISPLNHEHYALAPSPLHQVAWVAPLGAPSDSFPNAEVEPPTMHGVSFTHGDNTAGVSTHEIPWSEIELGQRIGEGGMGQVHRAMLKDGSDVAIKKVKKNWAHESLRKEAAVLEKLRHPSLVTFIGTTVTGDGSLGIVIGYYAEGSLYDRLGLPKNPNDKPRNPHVKLDVTTSEGVALRFRIAKETAQGIAHLHDKEFMHRDVKTAKCSLAPALAQVTTSTPKSQSSSRPLAGPRSQTQNGAILAQLRPSCGSVLLDDGFHAKLGDFGLAKLSSDPASPEPGAQELSGTHTAGVGTKRYQAPEVGRPGGTPTAYSYSCDVYSYGLLLWELTHGEVALKGVKTVQMGLLVSDGHRDDIALPPDLKVIEPLIKGCWDNDPTKRPTMQACAKELKEIETESTRTTGTPRTSPASSSTNNSSTAAAGSIQLISPKQRCREANLAA